MRKNYWTDKAEFYNKFVDKNVSFGGDGDKWPGEEGVEYEDRIKEGVNPHDIWVYINNLIEKYMSV